MERDWTDEQIQGVRGRLSEGKRQGMWISAIEVGMFLGLLTWWQKASMRGYGRPNEGRLVTVGETRARGITHIFVSCARPACYGHSRRIAIADLHVPPGRQPLPDDAAFLDIPNRCRFRCVKCGSRKVSIMAHWPQGPGIGGAHGQSGNLTVLR